LKVLKTQATSSQTTARLDIFEGQELPKELKKEIAAEAGTFLVEQILSKVGDSQSPVSGERFPALSPDYKKFKKAQGGTSSPDLELTGKMLNSLDFKVNENGTIDIGIFGNAAPQADGHNKFSGKENGIPQRRFLPAEGQSFKSEIVDRIDQIIADKMVDSSEIKKSDLKQIETSSELLAYLRDKMPGLSRSEIIGAVSRNVQLTNWLDDLDLLGLLDG
jgi:hypothetical protein